MKGAPERISRFLARAGIASRRHADEIVKDRRVHINGRPAVLGDKVRPGVDQVLLDGKKVSMSRNLVYILLNKPRGYITTCDDPFGRRTVLCLVEGVEERVFPVGRLDADADGLLLLTSDGDLAYQLTHPKHRVIKEYVVQVSGAEDPRKLHQMRKGVVIDGKKVEVDYARFLPQSATGRSRGPTSRPSGSSGPSGRPRGARLCIGVHEGEKHLIKNLCRAVGYEVTRLTRTRIGQIHLAGVAPGKWRRLTDDEVAALYAGARRGLEGDNDVER